MTQIGKRLSFNIRKLIRAYGKKSQRNFFTNSRKYIEYKTTKQDYFLTEATKLANWFLQNSCDSDVWEYPCWGYNFDWQARAFFLKKRDPKYNSKNCCVSMALYELGKITNNSEFIDNALNSALFINKFLLEKKDNLCFYKYVPHSKTFVHNANLWGSYWCFFFGC